MLEKLWDLVQAEELYIRKVLPVANINNETDISAKREVVLLMIDVMKTNIENGWLDEIIKEA